MLREGKWMPRKTARDGKWMSRRMLRGGKWMPQKTAREGKWMSQRILRCDRALLTVRINRVIVAAFLGQSLLG